MTNLTDEGLIADYFKWCKQGRVPQKYTTYIGGWLYTNLQQVRDAAKKETVENAVKAIELEPELSDEMPDEMWGAICGDRDAQAEAMRIAVRQTKQNNITAIRQMEGGK